MKTTLDNQGFAIADGYIHIYNTNPVTNEFTNESDEYLTSGVGLPANSYLDKPLPVKIGFVVVRGSNGWEYLVDHRNETIYSTETGQPLTVTEVGDYPKNTTIIAPTTAYDIWNGKKWVTDNVAVTTADIDAAEAEKSRCRAIADAAIVPLSDAVELDEATAEEVEKLKEWKKYRIALNRIDTSTAPDIEWPITPNK